ncbi:g7449 [Coccomyxa elongata]
MLAGAARGSVEGFQRIFLSWNYWDLEERAASNGGVNEELEDLPQSFESAEDYIFRFAPLVLEECGAQMLQANEEGFVSQPHPAVLSNYVQNDDFLNARLVLPPGAARTFRDNDVILLSKEDPNREAASGQLHALGKVEARQGEQVLSVVFYLTDDSQAGNPAGMQRVRAMRAGLNTANSCWFLLRLCNLSTLIREWTALHAFPSLAFKDVLLSANHAKDNKQALFIPQPVQQAMEAEYNESQMSAVTAGLDRSPVVLIQGPPGTGKTRTILGLLSIVLHAVPAHSSGLTKRSPAAPMPEYGADDVRRLWRSAAPWLAGVADPRDDVFRRDAGNERGTFGLLDTRPPVRVGKAVGPKAHVLVCAPSNSALDEIVSRLLQAGLLDWQGNRYIPSIVRVGLSVHHSVEAVSLDALVELRMRSAKAGEASSPAARDRIKLSILEEAHIVCSTLSFSGSGLFARMSRPFDVVVIDEAAQAVEPSTLVPLVTGCHQVFLVGDPVQLPATVISSRAVQHGYDRSLFKRLQSSGFPVQMLDTQYRMHPDISAFPSQEFYQGSLRDGEGTEASTTRSWHEHACFGPLALYQVAGREMVEEGATSIINKMEAEMVLCIYRELVSRYPHLRTSHQIAIISPYSAQVKLLRAKFVEALGEEGRHLVDVNTIDGFQGREKDIVIFSAVRSAAHRAGKIGFVADERRVNVALTRARASLLLVANFKVLRRDEHWANLVNHATAHKCLYVPQKPFVNFLGKVIQGEIGPAEDLKSVGKKAPFVAQAEPGVEDDPDLYSDGEADYMETDAAAAAGVDTSEAMPPAKATVAGLQDTDKAVHAPKRAKTGG